MNQPLSRVLLATSRVLTATTSFFGKRSWLLPVVAAVVLALVGWGVSSIVGESLRAQVRDELTTIREADVTALRMWLKLQEAEVKALADTPLVRQAVRDLADTAAASSKPEAALRESRALADLREHLQPTVEAMGFDGFSVISPDLLVLAADQDVIVGQAQAANRTEFIKRVLESGRPAVSTPFRSILLLAGSPDEPGGSERRAGRPIMLSAAPIRDGDKFVGVFALRIRPQKEFSEILRAARYGESGETYAFDEKGLLLSQSRFDEQLKEIGLLPNEPGARSILSVELRDPGVNLAAGHRTAVKRGDQPLTRMADDATRSRQPGEDVTGYNDYRGVPVVGAWTWLDEYGFGVATEVDTAEAFRPLVIVQTVFWVLFAVLVLCSGGLFVLGLVVAWQRREMAAVKQLGPYTLEEKLGEGGMGVVWKARHALLRRPTAVKLLSSDQATEAAVARFEREVQQTSRLNHPNTIAIYDYGRTPEGVFYYAMEYLDGIDLEKLVQDHGALSEGRVIHILRQVCGSLAEAHGMGLIHRDVKPANIILNHRGGVPDMVKVLDFGLVKSVGTDVALTAADMVVGTPLYMAPEAIDDPDMLDARADLYAVGVVGYYLLTALPVFTGKSTLEICRQHLKEQPQRPSDRVKRAVASDLEAVILRCLAKRPEERFATATELAEQLGRCAAAGSWSDADAEAWWVRWRQRAFVKTVVR